MKLTEGEKLILLMLCEIHEHLKISDKTDAKLIREALRTGNLWGLDRDYRPVPEVDPKVAHETLEILAMWERLEESFARLSPSDKKWFEEHASGFQNGVEFPGFSGNFDSEQLMAARFYIDVLENFEHFKDRQLSRYPVSTMPAYRRMVPSYKRILATVTNKDFTASQVAEVVTGWVSSG
jgi:uncharacterized protein YfbU (UPF0304 family)